MELLLLQPLGPLMLMVVVEIHERLGEENLVLPMKVLMLRLMDDCVLIEGQELMNHYVPNQKELLFHLMMDLILRLTEQNLLELVLQPLVLLVSSQMLDLLHRLLFQFLYLFQFVGAHRLRFVCFLFVLIVELVAFLVVVVVLQGFVLSLLLPQPQPQANQ